jgi:hypothetical protein
MNAHRLLALALLAGMLGCKSSESAETNTAKRLDQGILAILEGATRVEAFRVLNLQTLKEEPKVKRRIGGFLVTPRGRTLGKEFGKELAGILSDDRTYSSAWAGCFNPGVAFYVWKGDERIDILICFVCENLYCGPPAENAHENVSFVGSPARAQLVRLVKQAFPEDKEIQGLSEVFTGVAP